MKHIIYAIATIWMFSQNANGQETRIKDLTNLRGFRSNTVVGIGLIIGLQGTGDTANSLTTNQAVATMLNRLGMRASPEDPLNGSVAAVIVTGELPAFQRIGDKIDLKISTIGDAQSVAGGTLLITPLKAGDGQVYVIGQGSVVVGQASGAGASVLTTALIPDGGTVEREFSPTLTEGGKISLSLKRADSTNSTRVAEKINQKFKGFYAKAKDPVRVDVEVPPSYRDKLMEFVTELESLTVDVDRKAVVVLNERTGTVVMGSGVVIGAVAIAHGNLSIKVGQQKKDAPPKPDENVVNVGGATVGGMVESLNALGVKPADLVGILQAIHAAGALQAEIKFL